jgi:hypothetical protein
MASKDKLKYGYSKGIDINFVTVCSVLHPNKNVGTDDDKKKKKTSLLPLFQDK